MKDKKLAEALLGMAKELVAEDERSEQKMTPEEARAEFGRMLAASLEDRDFLTVEEVRVICASCAEKMEAKRMRRISKDRFFKAYESLPWDECIAKMKKNPKIKDPEKVCGYIKWHVSGKYKKK